MGEGRKRSLGTSHFDFIPRGEKTMPNSKGARRVSIWENVASQGGKGSVKVVTSCDNRGERGSKNEPKMCDVIFERPLRQTADAQVMRPSGL